MWWFQDSVPVQFKPQTPQLYPKCLHKVLFMVNMEEYFMTDGWPAENERPLYFKATSEIPLLQETLQRLLAIGLSKTAGLDAISVVELLVKRAAALHNIASDDFQVLYSDRASEVMGFLFQLSGYSFHDTISLPRDYAPPTLAISASYWKVSLHIFIFTGAN